MMRSQKSQLFAAVLLVGLSGAFTAHAGMVQSASEDMTGQAPARVYHEQNRAQFASRAPVIASGQMATALAQGELEGSRVNQIQPFSDGGECTLSVRFLAQGGAERISVPYPRASNEDTWILPARLVPLDGLE